MTMKLMNAKVFCVVTGERLRRHSLHAEPVFDEVDVMEVHWDLPLPAGVMAEKRGRHMTHTYTSWDEVR